MKSKSNKINCETCKFYNGNCTHKSNIGIRVKYRQETEFFVKPAKELEAECKNYAEREQSDGQ